MIDDANEVRELLEALATHLPMQAYATPSLVGALRNNGTAVNVNDAVTIDQAHYLGDEGGIACTIGLGGGKTVLIVSITHLSIDLKHPLAARIRTYQMRRTRRLANQSSHDPRRSPARRAPKPKS